MLFMLASMVSSMSLAASAAPGGADQTTLGAFQTEPTAELCYGLDTDSNLHLSEAELAVLAAEPYNYSEEQIAEASTFCANLPSEVLSVETGTVDDEQPQQRAPNIAVQQKDDEPASSYFSIIKRFCAPEVNNSPNANCNGRIDVSDDDVTVIFNIYEGAGKDGALLGTLTFNPSDWTEGSGSQGQKSTAPDFLEGGVYTVCEDPVTGWNSIPRPGKQGGANQEGFENCIIIDGAVPNNNELQFNNYPADIPYYEFDADKYFCPAEEAMAPEIGEPGEECYLATDEEFTLSLWLEGTDLGLTTEELLAGVVLTPGTYELYEGDLLLGPIVIEESNVYVDVLNYFVPEPETGTVIVEKFYCDDADIDAPVIGDPEEFDDCVAGTTEFDLLDDTLANGGTSVLGEGDNLFAGVTLPFGTYYLVEWFDDAWVEMATVVIDAENTQLSYTVINPGEEEEPGLGQVVKYFCTDPDITVPVVGDDESDYEDCELATAEQLEGVNFWVYPFGDAEAAIDVDDSALLGDGVTLPAGTHTLVEEFNGAIHELADLTIVAGETTTITVFNPVADEEITLNIYKLVCSGFSETHEDGCVESDELDGTEIEFTVTYTIGEEETTIETSLEIEASEGSAVLTLPLADSYTVCEIAPDGVEEILFVVPEAGDATIDENGCITFGGDGFTDGNIVNVIFWNDMEDETPETPEKPEEPKPHVKPMPKTVTKLPSTGSGAGDAASMAPWMVLASAAALAGAGAVLRKERPAA